MGQGETYLGVRIRPRELATGTTYLVDYRDESGRRRRDSFPTQARARGFAERLAIEREQAERGAVVLTAAQRQDAAKAFSALAERGADVSLAELARAHVASLAPPDSPPLASLVADYLEWMRATPQKLDSRAPGPYRPDTIRMTQYQLGTVAAELGAVRGAELGSHALAEWLDEWGFGPSNWDHHRRAVSGLYSWAIREGIVRDNPASGLRPPPSATKLPAIYTPETVAAVLSQAAAHHAAHVPALACGFFSGLRPTECQRLPWRNIDWTAGEILVESDQSKTHGDRLVTMTPNLVEWLRAYPRDGASVGLSDAATGRMRRAIRAALGISWPVDVARHCYATYHCALHGMDATAEQLGHTSTAMLHRHYRGLARNRKQAARAFFSIFPDGSAVAHDRHTTTQPIAAQRSGADS